MPAEGGVDVVVSGVNEFADRVRLSIDKAREVARRIVEQGALIIADSAKEQFRQRPSGSRRTSQLSGRVYYDGEPPYQAVPPNPTIRTGNTRVSIRPKRIAPVGVDGFMSQTGASTYYADFIQKGTRYIHTPFPFMQMGLENASDRLAAMAEEEWGRVL